MPIDNLARNIVALGAIDDCFNDVDLFTDVPMAKEVVFTNENDRQLVSAASSKLRVEMPPG